MPPPPLRVWVPREHITGVFRTSDGHIYRRDPKTGTIRQVRPVKPRKERHGRDLRPHSAD